MRPSDPETARLACACPQFIETATDRELEDWLAHVDPHLVVVTGDDPAPRATSRLRRVSRGEIEVFHPRGRAPTGGPAIINGVQFLLARSMADLEATLADAPLGLDPTVPTFVISGLLALEVDTTELSTTLENRGEYRHSLARDDVDAEYVHVSTLLPAGYRRRWDDLPIVGAGRAAGRSGIPLIALDCHADGRILTRELDADRLSLQALDGVGPRRAEALAEAGFPTREAIAAAAPCELVAATGIGSATARRIHRSARAIADGALLRTSDASLPPTGEPVYIDIETDGLNPTITWLIGVLDGSSSHGNYMGFLQRDPTEPARAVEDLMAWYTANASHRPLVAYGGWAFDFDVLYDHIVRYCPQYVDDWNRTYRFDPYHWAIVEDNAVFPGRTNTLEDVSRALGYERCGPGLTGAAVARAYQRWMATPCPETEPAWERFDAYCEDDVRGVAIVYEALAECEPVLPENRERRSSRSSVQGSLTEW